MWAGLGIEVERGHVGGGGIGSDVVDWIEASEASEPSELSLEVEEGGGV